MDEEKDQQVGQAPQPDSQDLPPSPAKRGDKPMTKGQRQRRQRSVFQYIAILFAAAFLLLLYSFMMERRQYQSYLEQNQEQIDSLQQSASAVQRLDAPVRGECEVEGAGSGPGGTVGGCPMTS